MAVGDNNEDVSDITGNFELDNTCAVILLDAEYMTEFSGAVVVDTGVAATDAGEDAEYVIAVTGECERE